MKGILSNRDSESNLMNQYPYFTSSLDKNFASDSLCDILDFGDLVMTTYDGLVHLFWIKAYM